jgi:hypothetical protein
MRDASNRVSALFIILVAVSGSRRGPSATEIEPGERLRRHESTCAPRDGCRREPLDRDPGRWTFCPDCLTLYDDYGNAVNQLRVPTRK